MTFQILHLHILSFGLFQNRKWDFSAFEWIQGENGWGKTTLMDAMFFLLYGLYEEGGKRRKKIDFLTRYESPLWVEAKIQYQDEIFFVRRSYDDKKLSSEWKKEKGEKTLSSLQRGLLNEGEFGRFFFKLSQDEFLRSSLYREEGVWLSDREMMDYDKLLLDFFFGQSYEKYMNQVTEDLKALESPRKKQSLPQQEREICQMKFEIQKLREKIGSFGLLSDRYRHIRAQNRAFRTWPLEKENRNAQIHAWAQQKAKAKQKYDEAQEKQRHTIEKRMTLGQLLEENQKECFLYKQKKTKWQWGGLFALLFLLLLYVGLFRARIMGPPKSIFWPLYLFSLGAWMGGVIFALKKCHDKIRDKTCGQQILTQKLEETVLEEEQNEKSLTQARGQIEELQTKIEAHQGEILQKDAAYMAAYEAYRHMKGDYFKLLQLEEKKDAIEKTLRAKEEAFQKSQSRYRMLQKARQVLDYMYEQDEKQSLPKNYRHLNRIIDGISQGKYVKIEISQNQEYFLQDEKGQKRSEKALSYGERKMLHLCLRITLRYGAPQVQAPLFFDESFGHMDDGRAQKIKALVKTLFQDCQIFMFSHRSA